MKKEVGVIFLLLLVISFTSAYSHLGDSVFLKVNGQNTNLQGEITFNHFKTAYSGGGYSSVIIMGHNANEIIVNINGIVKTLDIALTDGSLINTLPNKSPAVYDNYNLVHGEYATNILVSNVTITISLQQAINDGWFYVVPTCVSNCVGKSCGDNGCGGSCGSCLEGFRCNSTSSCEIFTEWQYKGCTGVSACGPSESLYNNDTYFFGCSDYRNGICYGCTVYVWAGKVLFLSGTGGEVLITTPGFLVYRNNWYPGLGYMFYSWGGSTGYHGKAGNTLYCFDIGRRPTT